MKRYLTLLSILLLVLGSWASADVLKSGRYIDASSGIIRTSRTNMLGTPSGRISFWSNSTASFQIEVPSDGLYKFIISAWGDYADGWPIMQLTIEGEEVCSWEVKDKKALYISNAAELYAGNYEVRISFINDYSNEAGDRNLFVDGIAFGAVRSENMIPMLMFGGRPLAAYGSLVEGMAAKRESEDRILPFYPEKAPIPNYSPTTYASSELDLTLENGMRVKLAEFETVISLDGQWKISGLVNSDRPFPENEDYEKGYWRANFNDSQWDIIEVPLNWYQKYPEFVDRSRPYVKGWYRKTFDLPQSYAGKRVLLKFGVIGYEATLYVNGNFAGTHHGDFTPWEIDITPWVKCGEPNTLAIRVFTDFGPRYGVIEPAKHTYGSQWVIRDIKGGIWQSVSLHITEPVYLKRVLISPNLASGTIEVDYWIENNTEGKQVLNLYAVVTSAMKEDWGLEIANLKLGELCLVPGTNQGFAEIKLNDPQLWSPDNPYLYYLTLAMADEQQKVVDARAERFGFREFKVVGKNFYLNNERIYLFGENIPAVNFGGYGKSVEQETKELADYIVGFKRQGYNIIRNAHQPIIPLALQLADEIGLMFYNEWSFCFTENLDQNEFEKRNLQELTEWVYRDYNHPSVVMWSLGNEVPYTNEYTYQQLDKQVLLLRELDRSQRPIGSFSGAAHGYGTAKLETDFLDLHTYLGLAHAAWTNFDAEIERVQIFAKDTYGENGNLNMPYILWEVVGFSWGGIQDPLFKLNDIDKYAEYAARDFAWGTPNGIGFAGSIGLAAALDRNRGLKYGREHLGKRIMERIRYLSDEVQGFAPWFHDYETPAATLWNQRLYVGVSDENGIPPTNLFAGRSYKQVLFAVNSQEREFENLEVKFTLVNKEGDEIALDTIQLPSIAGWEKHEITIEIEIPADLQADIYQLRLVASDAGGEVSRNFYDVYVQEPKILTAKIATEKRIALLEPNTEIGVKLEAILADLGIQYEKISDLSFLNEYDVLIIPPSDQPYKLFENQANTLTVLSWANSGGSVLQLEQNYFGQTPIAQSLLPAENTFVDIAIPAHPVFAGLKQVNFDTWQNPNRGYAVISGFHPFTTNALAVRGSFIDDKDVTVAVAEGTYGQGRIFASQLLSTALWDIDSAATTYLRNVLDYMLQQKEPYEGVRTWQIDASKIIDVAREDVVPIDLRPYVNRGFKDDVDGDQKGGWTDQGNNDFRMMPLGEQIFAGVPFEIIDPATNNDRSCIVLAGTARPYFPQSVEGIAVNGHFKRLFFLQTAAWSSNIKAGEYRINYEDGTTVKIDIVGGINIGDWWFPVDLPQANVGLIIENPLNHKVGLWVMPWDNPWPEKKIATIDFISEFGDIVPVLVAISGEKDNLNALVVDDFETEKKWFALPNGDEVLPQVERIERSKEPENVITGDWSLKATMPARIGTGSPVLFCKFPLDRLQAGEDFNYLTFWLKVEKPGSLMIEIPKDDWSSALRTVMEFRGGEWKKVRLNLREDLGLKDKDWGLNQLRGELFFQNRSEHETVFYLDQIQFE